MFMIQPSYLKTNSLILKTFLLSKTADLNRGDFRTWHFLMPILHIYFILRYYKCKHSKTTINRKITKSQNRKHKIFVKHRILTLIF